MTYVQSQMASSPNTPFEFDLQQRNTLNVSGLAAYVQRPLPDRVGWVHVKQIWLPDWRPKKWAYQVQHVEVTFESFNALHEFEAQQLDFEPLEVLMITAHTVFLTDDLRSVEAFFAKFMDRAEFARHPDHVSCPHEYADEKLSDELPARWSLIRRAWVVLLLEAQHAGWNVVWSSAHHQLKGKVTKVGFNSFEISTASGTLSLGFSDRFGAQFYRLHEDGYVQHLWDEPTSRTAIDAESLPIWSYALSAWVVPE